MYKIKEGFMLREVAGSWVVVAVGKASKSFKGVITLNETGAMLFNELIKGCEKEDLVKKMLEEYEVSLEVANTDIDKFIQKIKDGGLFE